MLGNGVLRIFCKNPWPNRGISTVAVFGAGVMGHGIAQTSAIAGNNVLLYDITPGFLDEAKTNITESLNKSIAKRLQTTDRSKIEPTVREILNRITFTSDIQAAFDNTELVIEAIFEKLEAKKKLFEKLEKHADKNTIFATNSLSLSVPDIAKEIQRKDRFMGIHFFFPVPKSERVELVRLNETSEETVKTVREWVWGLGKTPVSVPRRSVTSVNFAPTQAERESQTQSFANLHY